VALEGAHGLADLAALHRRGLTMLGLTWSFSNRYAGSSGDGGGGLTPEGERLVAQAQAMGVLVDVSHASRVATLDTCRVARAPIVASHSNAAAVADVPRNLTDPEIRCIAETGGVIGVNLHSAFLGSPASAARAADHFEHLRRIGGIGVVALGSDFDGIIRPPGDVPTAAELPRIWEELRRRGWAEWEIELARGENFLRAWAAARSIAGV
jgi:membrane dipeptidase